MKVAGFTETFNWLFYNILKNFPFLKERLYKSSQLGEGAGHGRYISNLKDVDFLSKAFPEKKK